MYYHVPYKFEAGTPDIAGAVGVGAAIDYLDGITFSYNYNGKDVKDVMTGSIKWVEDENRKANGKGYYEFNLRFNIQQNGLTDRIAPLVGLEWAF